jgi:multidrug efflux pump subunit AcrB
MWSWCRPQVERDPSLETQHGLHAAPLSRFDRFRTWYVGLSARVLRRRWIVVPAYLAVAALIAVFVGGALGRAIFPAVDAGQFTLRMRVPVGTRIEETESWHPILGDCVTARDLLALSGRANRTDEWPL